MAAILASSLEAEVGAGSVAVFVAFIACAVGWVVLFFICKSSTKQDTDEDHMSGKSVVRISCGVLEWDLEDAQVLTEALGKTYLKDGKHRGRTFKQIQLKDSMYLNRIANRKEIADGYRVLSLYGKLVKGACGNVDLDMVGEKRSDECDNSE